MSHKYYDNMLSEAVSDFTDLYQAEFRPYDQLVADGKKLSAVKKPSEWLAIYANLYINYVQTFRKLQDVYDQIIHPQKRIVVKKMLDNTMMRVVEIRNDMIMYNTSTSAKNSDFVNLDELLFDLKILPEQLEVPIPRYLREDDEKTKIRNFRINGFLEMEDRHLPEEEVIEIRNPVIMDPEAEMWMILVNERGRQGIVRGNFNRESLKQKKRKNKDADVNKEQISMLVLQKYIRAYIDREKVEKMRNEEMEFLGMLPSEPDIEDAPFVLSRKEDKGKSQAKSNYSSLKQANLDLKNPSSLKLSQVDDQTMPSSHPNINIGEIMKKTVEEVKHDRRKDQSDARDQLSKMVDKVTDQIKEHDVPDFKENLLYNMRNWITQYYEQHEGKELPAKVEDYYTKDDKAKPLSKEEEDALKKAKAEKEKAEKKAAEDKKKGKKTEAEQFMDDRQARGPDDSRPFKLLNEEVQKYVDTWLSKDDGDNFEQRPSRDIVIEEIMPQIEQSVDLIYLSTKKKLIC